MISFLFEPQVRNRCIYYPKCYGLGGGRSEKNKIKIRVEEKEKQRWEWKKGIKNGLRALKTALFGFDPPAESTILTQEITLVCFSKNQIFLRHYKPPANVCILRYRPPYHRYLPFYCIVNCKEAQKIPHPCFPF